MHVHAELKPFLATPEGEAAYKLVEHIQAKGHTIFMAGGSVRDLLLGHQIKDVDFATSAKPSELKSIVEVTEDHAEDLGSIVVRSGNYTFEITTFRKDSSDVTGRKPNTIEFGTLEEDAKRRDFTVNALYADIISGDVFDVTTGLADLQERIVRAIGEPNIRFTEDPLRILRALRLKGRIDGQYHPLTYRELQNTCTAVSTLAPNVIWREFIKMVHTPRLAQILEDAWELDVLQQFLPELSNLKGIAQPHAYHKEGDVWNHTLQLTTAFEKHHTTDVRIAALFHDIGKATTFSIDNDRIHFNDHASASKKLVQGIGKRFALPNKLIDKLGFLVGHHMMMQDLLEMKTERKAHWYYHEWFTELLDVFYLDIAGTTPSNFELYNAIYKDYIAFIDANPKKPKCLLSGQDIMDRLSIPPSKRVQLAKDAVLREQISGSITTKKEAIDYITLHKDEYTTAEYH